MTTLLSLLEVMIADAPRAKRDQELMARSRIQMERKGRGSCGRGVEYMAFEYAPLGGIHAVRESDGGNEQLTGQD